MYPLLPALRESFLFVRWLSVWLGFQIVVCWRWKINDVEKLWQCLLPVLCQLVPQGHPRTSQCRFTAFQRTLRCWKPGWKIFRESTGTELYGSQSSPQRFAVDTSALPVIRPPTRGVLPQARRSCCLLLVQQRTSMSPPLPTGLSCPLVLTMLLVRNIHSYLKID